MGLNTYPYNPFPASTEQKGSGGGSYVLPIAAADTLGGVKVGSGVSINSETGELSADSQIVDYSTTEQATGQKWIDGKEIFRKVVNFGALPNNTTKSVDSGLTNETIVEMRGFANAATVGTSLPTVTSNNRNAQMYYDYTNHKISIVTADDYSDYSAHVVLYYTKTETEE